MSHLPFLEQFVRTFAAQPFCQFADQTGWRKRVSKIDPFEFLVALIFGQLSASRQTLSSQAQTLTEPVTRQAVDQRYNARTVKFVEASFAHVLAQTLEWSAAHPQAEALQTNFDALYLLDSTSFDCPATLKDLFPACGGDGSAAPGWVSVKDHASHKKQEIQHGVKPSVPRPKARDATTSS